MTTLFDPDAGARLDDRIGQLSAASTRQWGTMDVGQMLEHTAGQFRLALAEHSSPARRTFLSYPLVKQLLVYAVPWPKNSPTVPELRVTAPADPADFEAGRARLRALIERFVAFGPGHAFAVHPGFGCLSGRAWGRLAWRHLDHHLRQFGV